MTTIAVKGLYTEGKWRENCAITISEDGVVNDISDHPVSCRDYLIPSFVNAHSHSFQFAMAGLAEHRLSQKDDFWTWRELMYNLAEKISDHDFKAIATYLYRQMIAAGYSTVVEFHYLHRSDHGEDLRRCEMLAAAAQKAGIQIVVVPIFYNTGNFGTKVNDRQKMFYFPSPETFLKLVKDLESRISNPYTTVGIGVHSVRAAGKDQTAEILDSSIAPFHIHVAEQVKEIDDCTKHYGKPPVQWLYENCKAGQGVNLVHATHLTAHEIELIEHNSGNVVLCPSTEANLGDGIFPADRYKGSFGIGSDSHILMNPFEELRLLEYTQRLRDLSRTILCDDQGENANHLIDKVIAGGGHATAQAFDPDIRIGNRLNALLIDEDHAYLLGKPLKRILSSLIFSADASAIKEHYIGNKNLLLAQPDEEEIVQSYRSTVKSLLS
jgi:formimidoylglutamate deiminase